jgi:SH3-like domain-containing protein
MYIQRIILAVWLLVVLTVPCKLEAKTGLPVPRFVSLRSGNINVRVGPGLHYPLEWVFVRNRLPVEIVAEFDAWRKIRDAEGVGGWVHQSMLSGTRMVLVLGAEQSLYKKPDISTSTPIIAKVQSGVIGKLLSCQEQLCRVQIEGYKGWILRESIWGIYKSEVIK